MVQPARGVYGLRRTGVVDEDTREPRGTYELRRPIDDSYGKRRWKAASLLLRPLDCVRRANAPIDRSIRWSG